MDNLTTKQKIILGVVICAMLVVIGIYGYISLQDGEELDISVMEENEVVDYNEEESGQAEDASNLKESDRRRRFQRKWIWKFRGENNSAHYRSSKKYRDFNIARRCKNS